MEIGCVSPISNSAASPRSHELRRSAAVSICSGVRNAHSHAMAARHPLHRSAARTVQSREIFCLNLDCQNSGRVEGVVQHLQPSWRCQKQTCTKITALNFGNTKSGRPRIFVTCRRKRNPQVQHPPQSHLGSRVLALDPRHHAGASRLVDNIRGVPPGL